MPFDKNGEKHPSYGVAVFSRFTASPGVHLFGSEFRHNNAISLTISRAERVRELAKDWIFPDKQLIRVNMSESQFVALVSRMNMGDGQPVTIEWVDGQRVEPPPFRDTVDQFDVEAQVQVDRSLKAVQDGIAELMDAIKTGQCGKTRLREICCTLYNAEAALKSGLPWIKSQMKKAMGDLVLQAKTEIEAHVTATATKIGLESIAKNAPQLEAGFTKAIDK